MLFSAVGGSKLVCRKSISACKILLVKFLSSYTLLIGVSRVFRDFHCKGIFCLIHETVRWILFHSYLSTLIHQQPFTQCCDAKHLKAI